MNATKRKISVSLDREIVEELEADDESLSTQINNALRDEVARRRRHRLLATRETAIAVRDTDRTLARLVGGLLSAAAAGSDAMVDAHVVATAVEAGGGTVVTGDPDDLERLARADPYVHVTTV